MAADRPLTIALDANGADAGPPRSRAAPRSRPRGGDMRVLVFGPAARDRAGARASRSSTRRSRSPRRPIPRAPCARTPEASIVAGRAAPWPTGAPTRSSPAARPAPRSPPGCSTSSAAAASTGRRSPCSCPCPGKPFLLLDCGANVEVRPEHLVQFAHMGAAFMEAVMGDRAPARGAAVQRRPSRRRAPRTSRPPTRCSRRPHGLELRRQRRGLRDRHRRGRRDRHRRLHRQRLPEGDGGDRRHAAARGARRGDVVARARRPAGCCCGRAARACATRSTPRRRAARSCSGLRQLGVVPHGSFGAERDRARDRARRARRARGRGRPDARRGWPPRGRCGGPASAARAEASATATVPDP